MLRLEVLLAKMAATVDHISAGRVEMGIGAGWYEHEWRAYGYGFPRAGERLRMLDEGVQIMREAWRSGEVTFHGRHYDVEGAIALYRRAIDTPGDALLDPRSHLVSLLLRRGEREEADALDRELRRAGPATSATYEYMSEVWAEHGEHQRALGWVPRGILRHEQGPPFSDVDLAMLCLARWQLREPAGHPPDDYDLIGIGMRERMAERAAQQGLG